MYINNEVGVEIDEKHLQHIASTVLNDYDFRRGEPEFTLSFVAPEDIQRLNRTFRKVDAVTDVLSFESGGETDPGSGREYIGDIVICISRAKEQAELSGHRLIDEISLLEIHGLLHLLGYDHYTDEEKQEMWKEQNGYLERLGIQLKRRPGEDFDF